MSTTPNNFMRPVMRTTTDHAQESPDADAWALTDLLLRARDMLPHAANGRPVAPSDPYALSVRKQMQQGRSEEWKRILAVGRCDIRDGVAFDRVAAAPRRLLSLWELDAIEEARRRAMRPLHALLRLETRAQARLDLAQLRAVESPTCQNALADVLREADHYRAALTDWELACTHQLSVVRGSARPVYGANMQVIR